jgi:hypothetical protein
MCTARLQAVGWTKLGRIRPSRARPKSRPDHGLGPGLRCWKAGAGGSSRGFMSLLMHHRYQCILTLGSQIVCYRLPCTTGYQVRVYLLYINLSNDFYFSLFCKSNLPATVTGKLPSDVRARLGLKAPARAWLLGA